MNKPGRPKEDSHWWVMPLDVLMIIIGMIIAYELRYRLQWFVEVVYDAPPIAYLPFGILFVGLIPSILWLEGAYRGWRGRGWLDHVYRIINSVTTTLVLILAYAFVSRPLIYSRLLLLEAGIGIIILMSLDRIAVLLIQQHRFRRGIGVRRVIIVGAGEVGRRVIRTIVAQPQLGYHIVGYVDDNPAKGEKEIGRIKGLGPVDSLGEHIDTEAVDEVLITLPWTFHRRILNILRECERHHINARIVPDLFQLSLSQVEVSDLGGVPLISVRDIAFSRVALIFKRVFDLCGAVLGLILGAPLFAIIALAIKLDSPGPVFFKQTRVGKNHRQFRIIKFRSMRVGAEQEQQKLQELNEADGPLFKIRDDPRLTRVGAILRRTSLDELPQVFNVIRGEMSLVGPRPPVPDEVTRYQPWHMQRLTVPGGMTGLWQVSGRSELTFDEMVLLDIYYIEHWSPWLDLQILLRTVPKVLLATGAY